LNREKECVGFFSDELASGVVVLWLAFKGQKDRRTEIRIRMTDWERVGTGINVFPESALASTLRENADVSQL
jgi:hypothetical protein